MLEADQEQPQEELYKKALRYIEETGMLMQMPRSHRRHLGNTFDTVASHCHHSGIIAYILATLENLPFRDRKRAMTMAMIHDIPEARTGDLDYVAKHYSKTNEAKAIDAQLKGLPGREYFKGLYKEWGEQKTQASRCAKDADALEQRYQEWTLMHQGNKMAERWYQDGFNHRVPFYRTESAKRLAMLLEESHPHEWWFTDLVEQGINQKHLNDLGSEG